MVLPLSEKAQILTQSNNIQSQLILQINGIEEIFGAKAVTKFPILDDGLLLDDGLFLDTGVEDPRSRPWISLEKTSRRITQQIEVDNGGTSSVTSQKIQLVDVKGQVSEIFKPGNRIPDILGAKAKFYQNFSNGGTHKDDSILILNGVISNVEVFAGSWVVTLDHPQQLKRQEIYTNVTADLNGAVNDSQTTIAVDNVAGFLTPADNVSTYFRVNDELIQYTGISGNSFTGCVRGQLGTTAAAHDSGTEISSRYRIQDSMIDLALKMLISGSGTYIEDIPTTNFQVISVSENIPNAVWYPGVDVLEEYGIVRGDLMTVSGSSNGNDFTEQPIAEIVVRDDGSYILVNVSLTDETESSATTSFKSQYDVYPQGCGMDPTLVDVEQHLYWGDIFSSTFLDYDFFLDDTINADDFISEEVYFVQGAYAVPRKGKVSMNMTAPGLAINQIETLDLNNVKEPASIGLNRSINKYLYSSITYKYNPDYLETDEFTAGLITLDVDSQNRINVGNKNLTIESRGLRRTAGTDQILTNISRRFLERYRFAAEFMTVQPFYGPTLNAEVGDTVIVDGEGLQIVDTNNGVRGAPAKLYEIVNLSRDVTTGSTSLTLLDTNFGITDARYGVVSPSSFIDAGSTVTRIRLKKSFSTRDTELEASKWTPFSQQRIHVHSPDYSFSEEPTIVGFDLGGDVLIVTTLSQVPQEDWVVDIADYPDTTDANDQSRYKTQFVYFNPTVTVTTGTSGTEFDVDDASELQIGSVIEIHSPDYSEVAESVITNLVGNSVTVEDDLGFTPATGYTGELIGFKDDGLPYRIF